MRVILIAITSFRYVAGSLKQSSLIVDYAHRFWAWGPTMTSWLRRAVLPLQAGAAFLICTGPIGAIAAEPGEAVAEDVRRFEITIRDRKIARNSDVIRIIQGDEVELVWITDEIANLHLHGYDIELDITPEAPTVMAFKAHATGRYPITSHGFGEHQHGHETLLYIEVYPR